MGKKTAATNEILEATQPLSGFKESYQVNSGLIRVNKDKFVICYEFWDFKRLSEV
jgi:hypothetical protein